LFLMIWNWIASMTLTSCETAFILHWRFSIFLRRGLAILVKTGWQPCLPGKTCKRCELEYRSADARFPQNQRFRKSEISLDTGLHLLKFSIWWLDLIWSELMEKNCGIYVVKVLYFVKFLDFIWIWTVL